MGELGAGRLERAAIASQSSNSENGDHTYNPYSFKRLQDAIFKKSELLKDSKKPAANLTAADKAARNIEARKKAAVVSSVENENTAAEFMPRKLGASQYNETEA